MAGVARFEVSAGGIVQDKDKLLMVRVQNLEGDKIWTFPKGHIEKGEKAPEAALREVEEETGWKCEIVKNLERVEYWFTRDGQRTHKTVTWFLMKPLAETGAFDANEILEVAWVPMAEAQKRVRYRSDKKILRLLSSPRS